MTNRESLDAIAALALGLPAGSQIAIGSRDVLPLPAARLRSQGGLVEIGVDDLSMGHPEATSLLGAAGAELSEADVAELVKRTEGWPVGLYLAALAIKAGGQSAEIGATFTGDDRFMGDYLRSEFLDRVSRADVLFLTRTSILDRMCGPLCDAVTGGKRSANVLERLESRNLLVVPLDRRREWFRYHQLFRDLLSSELRRREPANVAELHLRAATWCEDEWPAGGGHRPRSGGGRCRSGRPPRVAAGQSGLGERARRHRDALDGVVRGQRPARTLPGDCRARGPDARLGRTPGRHGAMGGGRRADLERRGRSPTATRSRAHWRTCAPSCVAMELR